MSHDHSHSFDSKDLEDKNYLKVLKICFGTNFTMFFVEVFAGFFSKSLAILADSVDFLSDSVSYGVGIYAINKQGKIRSYAAIFEASTMIFVAIAIAYQAVNKLINPSAPIAEIMGATSILAFIINFYCAYLLSRFKGGDSLQKSLWLCSRNDAINNLLILVAAIIVYYTGSGIPDLLVAAFIIILEAGSAYGVIKQAIAELKKN
ncbi:MAG TPA: cation transporter [Alphaproteobacteria bacterium]|nr:cation transporter [Alphaproteobacteria bacterium]